MKQTLSFFLILLVVFNISSFSIASDSDTSDNEPVHDIGYIATLPLDLLDVPAFVSAYRKDKSVMDVYKKHVLPNGNTVDEAFTLEMDMMVRMNYLLLPGFVGVDTLKPGDVTLKLGDYPYGYIPISGKFGESTFLFTFLEEENTENDKDVSIYASLKMKNMGTKDIDGIQVTAFCSPKNSPNPQQIYVVKADGNYYRLIIFDNTSFDEIWDNLSFKPFPLANGFFSFNGKRYYYYNGELLFGWYRISGNIYYFKSDGTAATGIETIDGKRFTFDENGVYTPAN
jgi:hypothetical protein